MRGSTTIDTNFCAPRPVRAPAFLAMLLLADQDIDRFPEGLMTYEASEHAVTQRASDLAV